MESRKAYPSPRCWKCFQYKEIINYKSENVIDKCKSCEQHSTASAFHCDLWRENLRLFKASRPKRFPIFQAYLLGHPIFHSILMEYSFKLIHWNSFDCFFWNSYEILMNSYKIRKRSARAARKIFTYTIGVFIILLLKFEWRSCTLFVLLVMILLQKFLPTRNILALAAQKILNISTIFHNFTKKF